MTTSTDDFFGQIDGALTPEQAMQALSLMESGDTGNMPDDGGAPATTTAPDDKSTTTAEQADKGGNAQGEPDKGDGKTNADNGTDAGTKDGGEGFDPANTVVVAKDGKHHLPFAVLEKARQSEQHWKAQAEAAQQQLAELQAQAQARADAGQAPTATDNMVAQAQAAIDAGVDASIFGDFSEEALAKGVMQLVNQTVQSTVQKALSDAAKAEADRAARKQHEEAIFGRYPDALTIVQSTQFSDWVNAHPTALRNAIWGLFDTETGGTTTEILEVLDAYSKATGSAKEDAKPAAPPVDAAKAAAAAVKVEPPISLSAIPGGRADARTPDEQLAELSGVEMVLALESKSPAQIEAWLNKQM